MSRGGLPWSTLALAVGVLVWVMVLGLLEPGATLRVAVPLVLAVTVVGRVVVLVEQQRPRVPQEDATIATRRPHPTAGSRHS